jgi:carboxyl-terminal processing protease
MNVLFLTVGVGRAHAGKIRLRSHRELDLLSKVFQTIRKNYVDKDKAKDQTSLIYGGVEGMIKALDDPYTRFMRPRPFTEMKTESKGEFGGLGIVIGMRDGHVTVISPMAGTPAYKKGVQAADIIVKVNGETVEDLTLNQVVDLLRGKVNTKVEVTFFRPSLRKLIPIEIIRANIPLPGVRSVMLPGRIGYAYAPSFGQKTAVELEKAISSWEKDGLKGFILDLRSNPGGLLDAAVSVGRIFLGPSTIVSVRNRDGAEMTYKSFRRRHQRWPLVVLIDEGSASASEIVAGAVRDNHRGVLVGAKSFGKGSVQTVLPFVDGSAMALTTAYYYTPSGELIHKKGIQPHISVPMKPLTTDKLIELRQMRARLMEEPSLDPKAKKMSTSEVYETLAPLDPQLSAAVNLIQGASLISAVQGKGR